MKPAAVILDMDGLMLDTESIYKRSWQQAAREYGYTLDDGFYFTLIGQPNPACETALFEHYGIGFPMAAFRDRWVDLWRKDVAESGIPIKPGLTELLSFLDEHRVLTAIATSTDREYATLSLQAARLERRFEHIITGDEVAHGKPSPDIYIEAARRLGVAAKNCVAIEDSDAGVIAATGAGMTTIMVPDLKPPSAAARSAAYRVVKSLVEARDQLMRL